MKEIFLAGGCFWGLQKFLDGIRGVVKTEAGYANGETENPTYADVCSGQTGHAEAVRVTYDERLLPLPSLLELYFSAVDPLAIDRQGNDVGRQYRTGIYAGDSADLPAIRQSIERLERRLGRPVAIELAPLKSFGSAEERHQKYLDKHPGGYCHISARTCAQAAARIDPGDYRKASDDALERALTQRQHDVTQKDATEPPFQNDFWDERRPGIYVDVTTGEPLFASSAKFDAGCGWPSFTRPIDPFVLRERHDRSLGMERTEVRSRVGDAHLGHVFEDGPQREGGRRYCINSAALRFVPREDMEAQGYGHLVDLAE